MSDQITELKPSTKRVGRGHIHNGLAMGGQRYTYRAVLKDASDTVVWQCEHVHTNRTSTTRYGGQSAIACAESELGTQRRLTGLRNLLDAAEENTAYWRDKNGRATSPPPTPDSMKES